MLKKPDKQILFMKKIILFILFPLLSMGQTKIGADIDPEAAGDQSGFSVSLSKDGTTLAIGAPLNDGKGTGSGSVRVYKNVTGAWIQIGKDLDGEGAGDAMGWSVSLSNDGTTVAIGAPGFYGNGSSSGLVYVYKNVSGTWTRIGSGIYGEAAGYQVGSNVSLSSDGSIVAVGAPGYGIGSGLTRVYKNVSGTWTKVGSDIFGPNFNDNGGGSISLSGDGSILAIGYPNNDNYGNVVNSGSVSVYKNVSGTWMQIGSNIYGEVAGDISGYSVSLSNDGSIIAIGSPNNNGKGTSSGSVRVYKNVSGTWMQIGLNIDGEAAYDKSGYSVSLSNDGSIVAIGAPGYFGAGSGPGSVCVYKNISNTWKRIESNIPGEYGGEASGYSVSLSNDGSIVAIGAPYNLGKGSNSGSVRVYNLSAVLKSDSFVLANSSIYPNPASEQVTISLREDLKLEKVNIYNSLGQLVKTENKNVIYVNALTKGSYFFEVITIKGKATKKIIVK